MDITQLLGLAFITLGLISVSSYTEDFGGFKLTIFYKELKPMRERWGVIPGTILHIVGYVVAPLGFGLLFLFGFVF